MLKRIIRPLDRYVFSEFWKIFMMTALGFPLLIIIIGFNAMSGERERGTLRQLLSLGVPVQSLLVGKAMALAASIAVLVAS
jgi:ABC-2 type transport system permease protein